MLGTDAAIDLGTSRTRIYLPQQGVVIDEPSVVAVDNMTEEIIAIGQEAYEMVGRTSQRLTVTYPLVNGVISNFILVEQMVGYFLKKVSSSMVFMPRVVACIPGEVTEVEKRAVVNSISTAGVRKICLIEEPIAAAMGAGIDIFTPHGSLVVDIGGGTTDMAVVSLGGVSTMRSVKLAGTHFDEAIIKYMRRKYNLIIGQKTAENAKTAIGCVYPKEELSYYVMKGRNGLSGLPQAVTVSSDEMLECLVECGMQIAREIQDMLEETQPELVADIYAEGIVLTGGSARLYGFDNLIAKKTKLPVHVAENPDRCVVLGAGKGLEYIDKMDQKGEGMLNPLLAEY